MVARCNNMNSAGEFYQSASEFVAAADQFQQARDISRLDRLREARLKLVRALLKLRSASAHDAIAATLPAIIAACVRSNVRVHPRTSAENELFTRCLEHLKPWR